MATKDTALTTTPVDIIDIDLSIIRKKRFRIDGDDNKILELNTSDLNVITRLEQTYPKLKELEGKIAQVSKAFADDTDSDASFSEMSKAFEEIDSAMREAIDTIFNAPVSAVCGSDGSMYDPIDGKLRYEHIIDRIMPLYEQNFEAETRKIRERVNKATSKYTKKKR